MPAAPRGVTAPWNDVNHTVPGIVFEMSCSMWLHDTSVASSDVSCASSWSTCAACAFRSALSSIEACNSALCASTAAFSSCLSDRLCLARYVGTPSNTISPAAIASTGLSALEDGRSAALRLAACTRREVDDDADAGTTEREPDGSRQVRVEARVVVLGEPDVTDLELLHAALAGSAGTPTSDDRRSARPGSCDAPPVTAIRTSREVPGWFR